MENFYEEGTQLLKIEELKKYYEKKGLTIIGLNDSRGVNTKTLFTKGVLEYLSEQLKSDGYDAKIINTFSLMFNKTEHINYLLESNLSLDEIKDLQVTGMISALEKAMQDFHLPKCLGQIGYISKLLYRPKKSDKEIFLTDTIKKSKEPIIIYSCGANDLMREGWNNPSKIERDYKNREKNMRYDYTLFKLQKPETLKNVIGRVEDNINNIFTLNNNADICVLGLYIPKLMKKDGMKVFNYAIEKYNEYLIELCEKYKMTYIDTHQIDNDCDKNETNFLISAAGHKSLAHKIISELYDKKIWYKTNNQSNIDTEFKIQNHKSWDLLINLKHDLIKVNEESKGSFGRQKEVYEAMKKELERQIDVVEKVLMKRM